MIEIMVHLLTIVVIKCTVICFCNVKFTLFGVQTLQKLNDK